MIGALDLGEIAADGAATIQWHASPAGGSRHMGCVGFCWGGGLTDRLAVAVGRGAEGGGALLRPRPRSVRSAARAGGDADHPRRARQSRERDRAALGGGAARGGQGRDRPSNFPMSTTPSTTTHRRRATIQAAAQAAWAEALAFFRQHLR